MGGLKHYKICLRSFNWDYKKRPFTMDFIYGFHLSSSNPSNAVTIYKSLHCYNDWLIPHGKLSLKKRFQTNYNVCVKTVITTSWLFKYSSGLEFSGAVKQIINCLRSKQTPRKTPEVGLWMIASVFWDTELKYHYLHKVKT